MVNADARNSLPSWSTAAERLRLPNRVPEPARARAPRNRRTGSPRSAVVIPYAVIFGTLLGMDGCFWFTADFSTFHLACDGPWQERLGLTALGAAGPFAVVMGSASKWGEAFLGASLCVPAIALGWFCRRFAWCRIIGCVGVVIWFLEGCGLSSLRIT